MPYLSKLNEMRNEMSYKNSMAVMILQWYCGFSMIYVILHNFPGLENSLTKFHDSLWLINVIDCLGNCKKMNIFAKLASLVLY